MRHIGTNKTLSFIVKSLCIVLLVFGLFGIVWLRSEILRLEYSIADLEKKKMEYLKEKRMLFAEKARLLSFEMISASLGEEFVFPDRTRVIHVKKQRGVEPHKVLLKKSKP